MAILSKGRVCKLLKGRDAGKVCVITARVDEKTMSVTGPNIKSGKVNYKHLEPLPLEVKVTEKSTPKEVSEALEKAGVKY
ncbi:MAG: 50S ribosomal protein L14e [Candidatus Altiarchaeota archaeon]